MNKIEFSLTMPSIGSWNGRWSGEGRNYLKYKNLSKREMGFLGLGGNKVFCEKKSWGYRWDDGWGASVIARVPDGVMKDE